jgi:hypothetical protein
MSRSWNSHASAVVAMLALAMPLAARNTEKSSKPIVSTTMILVDDATVGGKQVKAGTYDVKASESSVRFLHDGKVVAESPIEWKDEQSKQKNPSVSTNSGAMKDLHFAGKGRYAELPADSTTITTGQK